MGNSDQIFKKPKGKSHLDKDFLEELKHKLWSTRGSRFQASDRLKTRNKYSVLSVSLLSAYLIIFGLLSVYNLYNPETISENLIPFTITSLSIFLLVFSLFENSKEYSHKAIQFHDCALEIARLYNELQNFKSYNDEATIKDKKEFSFNLQCKYQSILEKYENHLQIDNKIFKSEHRDYYDDIKWYQVVNYRIEYFFKTYFLYLISIVLPGIVLSYIMLKIN
ncbi:SLATT domain-containing protein [Ancylomarina sp.]|uniref:SLATT domain-containing protein n=1 Tax=Ancylomarina sp. TaxID=1970196 RepID=UPI003565E0F7